MKKVNHELGDLKNRGNQESRAKREETNLQFAFLSEKIRQIEENISKQSNMPDCKLSETSKVLYPSNNAKNQAKKRFENHMPTSKEHDTETFLTRVGEDGK